VTDSPQSSERAAAAAAAGISLDLLDLLVCPVDKAELRLEGTTLVCTTCQRRYPIENGIPNMLVEDDDE
jgi:uncharacterized protein YbaR (Trm112 family)